MPVCPMRKDLGEVFYAVVFRYLAISLVVTASNSGAELLSLLLLERGSTVTAALLHS